MCDVPSTGAQQSSHDATCAPGSCPPPPRARRRRYMGIRCGYHYSPVGVPILANAVAESFKSLLAMPDA